MTDETIALVDERRRVKCSGAVTNKTTMNVLTKRIRRSTRKDFDLYVQETCADIERCVHTNNPKDMFDAIRVLTMKFTPRAGSAIKMKMESS